MSQESSLKTIVTLARKIERLDRERQATAQHRDDAMRAARDAGATWRQIALAAGMTEHGVRKAMGISRTGMSPGVD